MNQLRKTGHTICYLSLSHNSVCGIQITGNEIREKLYRMFMFFYIFFLFWASEHFFKRLNSIPDVHLHLLPHLRLTSAFDWKSINRYKNYLYIYISLSMLHIPARKRELKGSQGLKQTYGSYQKALPCWGVFIARTVSKRRLFPTLVL